MATLTCRRGKAGDLAQIKNLYTAVAQTLGGIAREADEITNEYLHHWIDKSIAKGVWLVICEGDRIVGSVHAYPPTPRVFSHLLADLTIAIHPEYQGRGAGRKLMESLLTEIKDHHSGILRVELLSRESNFRAIKFYQSLGFKIEGRLENRIKSVGPGYEADICLAWLRSYS